MNKNALKIFAVDSKKELMEKIQIKAMQYGIEKDKIKNSQKVSSDSIVINGKPLSKEEKLQREKLITKIKLIDEEGGDGYKQVIEEVVYTWFNRFTALRFMEVNNYLPTRVRALSSEIAGSVEPELVKEASNVDLPVDKQKIYEMKLNNDMEGLFKYMIIAQCNALNISLPFMFEKIGHYTELLFPDGLLNEGAFIRRLTDTEVISESDWGDVEIIGWLYQYYISEEKDRVIQAKKKYKKDEIPFATQLFTPDWIVRYMVQNTLGRYWIESHPENKDLKNKWEYYLENPNQDADIEEKLASYINKELRVEDIKCFDPCMGSGHVLVYMFDVLYQIYEKCGYMNREIPQLIIENNLYGLDIDDRAYQLACFSVIMKGMKYNNRLLRSIEREAETTGGEGIKLNLASIQETNNLNDCDIAYIAGENEGENYNKTKELIELFRNAKIYGSLIKLEDIDEEFFKNRLEIIANNPSNDFFEEESKKKVNDLLFYLIKQARIMINLYDLIVTNPPYMGRSYMNASMALFTEKNYPENKNDLFSAFIEYSTDKVNKNGHIGILSPGIWMTAKTYFQLRDYIINMKNISTLVQLEYNSFECACVPVTAFTLRNSDINLPGHYISLTDFPGIEIQQTKLLEATKDYKAYYRYINYSNNFNCIPKKVIAYWVNPQVIEVFKKYSCEKNLFKAGRGIATGKDEIFVRLWHEVKFEDIEHDTMTGKKKWVYFNKGGKYRKWYGNNEFILLWENNGQKMRDMHKSNQINATFRNEDYFFKKCLTYTYITIGKFNARISDERFAYSGVGPAIRCEDRYYVLAFINTKLFMYLIKSLKGETMTFESGDVDSIPLVNITDIYIKNNIEEKCKDNILICKNEWDSYEISWDFKTHPFLAIKKKVSSIEQTFNEWDRYSEEQFNSLKSNEEELNRIFLNIYGLQDVILPDVSEADIGLRKANRKSEIKSFISYATGCMLGRYSLDNEGLIYSGGNFDSSKYNKFKVDEDNIIPMLSESYFEDDIISKFVEFVKVTFGEETLSENIEYIAEALGKRGNETAKESIRRYFLTDFYKDHLQTYKNRPIYWMFTSGKQKAFNCLIYMHRYDKTTLSRIRTDYLHELQDRLDTERKALVDVVEGDYSTKEKSEAKKKLTSIDKQIDELKKYDEVLHHMADMQIEIDLDDGVVVNYEKFKGLLAKI